MNYKALFWFRNDLRIENNTALINALRENKEVIPIYVIDPNIINSSDKGSAKIKFIFDSLKDLSQSLSKLKSKLIIRYGKSEEQIIKLSQEYNISKIYFNRIYDIESEYLDEKIKPLLEDFNLKVFSYKDNIIFDKTELFENNFKAYKKSFKVRLKKINLKIDNKLEIQNLMKFDSGILTLSVPTLEDYEIDKTQNYPVGGENIVKQLLNNFDKKNSFLEYSDIIFPYFEVGNISIKQLIKNHSLIDDIIKYNYYTFYKFENVDKKGISEYHKFLIWCRSETGNPIVDACVKQINDTYKVNSKIFSYVLNYSVNILGVDLKLIERYLSQKIVNISPAFLRYLFSEYSEKLNYKDEYINNYIKTYLTVVKNVPEIYIREPYKMPLSLQRTINCIIGKDYPYPLNVDIFYQEVFI